MCGTCADLRLAITCFPVLVTLTFFVPETLRCLVGNGEVYASRKGIFTMPKLRQEALVDQKKFPRPPKPTPTRLIKPLYYLPSLIVSVNGALLFAGLYAMYVTFPDVWQTRYGFSTREVGYAYLAPGKFWTLCINVWTHYLSRYSLYRPLQAFVSSCFRS